MHAYMVHIRYESKVILRFDFISGHWQKYRQDGSQTHFILCQLPDLYLVSNETSLRIVVLKIFDGVVARRKSQSHRRQYIAFAWVYDLQSNILHKGVKADIKG